MKKLNHTKKPHSSPTYLVISAIRESIEKIYGNQHSLKIKIVKKDAADC